MIALVAAVFADQRECHHPSCSDFFRQDEKTKDNFDFANKASKTAN